MKSHQIQLSEHISCAILRPQIRPNRLGFVLANLLEVHQLFNTHVFDVKITSQNAGTFSSVQQWYLQLHSKNFVDIQQIQGRQIGSSSYYQQFALWIFRYSLQQYKQSLHYRIIEIGSRCNVLDQPFNVINDDQRLLRFVGISKDFIETKDTTITAHSYILLRTNDLHICEF